MAESYPHIVLNQTGRSVKYTSTGGGGGSKYESPPRPAPASHGKAILDGLAKAKEKAEKDLAREPLGEGLQFIPMEFEQHHDFPMILAQLEGDRLGVRIVNARTVGERTRFTVAMTKTSVMIRFG